MGGTPPQAQEAARTFPCSHRRESSPRHLDLGLLSPEPGGGQISVVLSHPLWSLAPAAAGHADTVPGTQAHSLWTSIPRSQRTGWAPAPSTPRTDSTAPSGGEAPHLQPGCLPGPSWGRPPPPAHTSHAQQAQRRDLATCQA